MLPIWKFLETGSEVAYIKKTFSPVLVICLVRESATTGNFWICHTGNFGSCVSGTFTNQRWQFLEIAINGDLCEWPDLAIFRSGLSHKLLFLASSFLANFGNFHKLPILASPFVAIFGKKWTCSNVPEMAREHSSPVT